MSPKKFDWQEREDVCIRMLEAGYELIRQYGMTHSSVEKVTAAVGLAKAPFTISSLARKGLSMRSWSICVLS